VVGGSTRFDAARVVVAIALCACSKPAPHVDTAPTIPILVAVRTGAHDGFDRIVFEFRPSAPATYRAGYLAGPAVACGSGENVTVDGSHTFAISFSGVDAHEFNGEEARSSIPQRELRPELTGVRHLKLTCDFEAEVAWAIGLRDSLPYSITAPDARRLVVDFQTRKSSAPR
jgi:hypothetical protein